MICFDDVFQHFGKSAAEVISIAVMCFFDVGLKYINSNPTFPTREQLLRKPTSPTMNEDDRGYSSPLLLAIRARNADQVKRLLETGRDPNRVSVHDISLHAAGFLRFGPFISEDSLPDLFLTAIHTREDVLLAIGQARISALTSGEIEDRFGNCTDRFLTESV